MRLVTARRAVATEDVEDTGAVVDTTRSTLMLSTREGLASPHLDRYLQEPRDRTAHRQGKAHMARCSCPRPRGADEAEVVPMPITTECRCLTALHPVSLRFRRSSEPTSIPWVPCLLYPFNLSHIGTTSFCLCSKAKLSTISRLKTSARTFSYVNAWTRRVSSICISLLHSSAFKISPWTWA